MKTKLSDPFVFFSYQHSKEAAPSTSANLPEETRSSKRLDKGDMQRKGPSGPLARAQSTWTRTHQLIYRCARRRLVAATVAAGRSRGGGRLALGGDLGSLVRGLGGLCARRGRDLAVAGAVPGSGRRLGGLSGRGWVWDLGLDGGSLDG
jgi:hypothetical protein